MYIKKSSIINRYLYMFIGVILYLIIHEGIHFIQAIILGIFEGVRFVGIFGVEIMITKPLTISGLTLALFSGASSLVTIIIGYMLLIFMPKILELKHKNIKSMLYFITIVFMLIDSLYLSVLSLIFGGDINGISQGLDVPYFVIRIFYGIVFLVNLIIVIKRVYPAYVNDFNNHSRQQN